MTRLCQGYGPNRAILSKILVSVKCFALNSGAGNGLANFMGAWKNCVLSAGKPSMPIKFLVLGGGGGIWVFLGGEGGSSDFIFMGARIFLRFASLGIRIAQIQDI